MRELETPEQTDLEPEAPERAEGIAVVGMAGRFPGARGLEEFWRNLEEGVESIRQLTDEELLEAGVPREMLDDPRYVKAGAGLDDVDRFDAPFFDVSPREAELIDPQQRMFLEAAWQAMEDAGYDSRQVRERIGVYAAVGANSYLFNIYSRPEVAEQAGRFNVLVASEKDYLASRVSFKLDLRGPAVNVQSACSSSLLAVHLACESLHSGESDMALAGGVFAHSDKTVGYRFREGDIKAADGHCRPFDADATGTIFSAGCGVVALKRLADALEDGDTVRAVLRGSAVNNDGAAKVGYTAPGVPGQRAVVSEALAVSGVDPETIDYIEAHGTATALGDPIEVTALTQAFRAHTDRRSFCALGSVKGNIGHADAAAGIAALIKTVLALEHRKLPPSLHFERPNPQIDFESSPFFVNGRLRDWEADGAPRRAGVSSFGIGGTNVHAVLEEAPPAEPSGPSRPCHLLTVSARTPTALESSAASLADRLEEDPALDLADVAYTLAVGRRPFEHRRAVVCRDREEAVALLRDGDPKKVVSGTVEDRPRRVAFLFSGQGSQYPGMAAGLHREEAGFREPLDRCAELLEPHLGFDLREVLFPAAGEEAAAGERLARTDVTQPALFAVEYALARLWIEWGVEAEAMAGHSVGEYVAAVLAGVLELPDALALVAARGRLMQELPGGSMLTVSLPPAELEELLGPELSLAATNGPKRSVVSGPDDAVAALEESLWSRGVACRPLRTSHAFHSGMMEPMLEPFRRELARVELRPPRLPYVSNVTGDWITPEEATDPEYWLRHVRQTVRFSEGVATLAADPDRIFVEVGPGTTLATLVRQHPGRAEAQPVVASTRHPKEDRSDLEAMLAAAGELWVAGVALDGTGLYRHQRRRRLPLPTYPFERERYWIEPGEAGLRAPARAASRRELDEWFYLPAWRPSVPPVLPAGVADEPRGWLLLAGEDGLSGRIAERMAETLTGLGQDVTTVRPGDAFRTRDETSFEVAPGRREDYESLLEELAAGDRLPDRVLHLWTLGPATEAPEASPGGRAAGDEVPQDQAQAQDQIQERGFYSLLALAQALGRVAPGHPVRLVAASSGMQRVEGETALTPEKATLLGPCRVIPREYPHVSCVSVDVDPPARGGEAPPGVADEAELADVLLAEAWAEPEPGSPSGEDGRTVAYRGGERRVASYEAVRLPEPPADRVPLRSEGVYLITGGLGGIGLAVAEHLAREYRARLVLVSRSGLPPREEWTADRAEGVEGGGGPGDARAQARIQAVRALEEAGAEVEVEAADVADPGALREVVERARERFGALHGVIHAAGVAGGGMIQLKKRSAAAEVLAPKLAGTRALATALDGRDDLDFVVLCSSTFAVLGGVGQVDYSAANAYLDAFAQDQRLRGRPWIAVDWSAWREVGMAVETPSGLAAPRRPDPQPSPEPEAQEAAPVNLPEAGLLGEAVERSPERTVYRGQLAPESHWVLAEHRVAGLPTVPGTTYLEMVRAAFAEVAGPGPVSIRELLFASPLSVPEGEGAECRLTLTRGDAEDGGDGAVYAFAIESRKASAGVDDGWQEHAAGRVEAADGTAGRQDLEALRARCPERLDVEAGWMPPRGGVVEWGPRWSCLRSLQVGEDQALAELELPEAYRGELDDLALHPALLDVATAAGTAVAAREVFLPMSYGRVDALRPLPSRFYSYARRTGAGSEETLSFDVTLLDGDGAECVRIEGFTLKRVGGAVERLARSAAAGSSVTGATEGAGAGLYARGGITNAEGIAALRRLLAVPRLGRVVVSPVDLPALLHQASQAPGTDRTDGGAGAARERHARPDTGAEFAEPRTELEKTLAGIWSDVLGIDRVGLDDDFFRLGGDSVLGIQVIARTGELGIQLRPEQLFEHATLRELAAALGETPDAGEAAVPVTPFQRRVLAGATTRWVAADAELDGGTRQRVERALAAAVDRHEALRLRFPDGAATEGAVPIPPEGRAPAIRELDLEGGEARGDRLREVAAELGATLDPVEGPVLAAAWAEGDDGPGVLLLVAHRAVADGRSLASLAGEVQDDCTRLASGEEPASGPDAPTFRDWARALVEDGPPSAGATEEMAPDGRTEAVDAGGPPPAAVSELDAEASGLLTGEAGEVLRAEPHEILLAALGRSVLRRSGQGTRFVEIEWDGRGSTGADGAVGCFLRSAAVSLEASNPGESAVEAVRRIKESLRRTPGEVDDGRVDGNGPGATRLRLVVAGGTGAVRTWSGGGAAVDLEAQASVSGGRLRIDWWVAVENAGSADVEDLAESTVVALREIAEAAREGGAESVSPADFPEADLSQEDLDSVLSKLE